MRKAVWSLAVIMIIVLLTGCPNANFNYDSQSRNLTVAIDLPKVTSGQSVTIDQAFPGIKAIANITKIGFAWIDPTGVWKADEQFAFSGFPQTVVLTRWVNWNYPNLRVKPFVADKKGKIFAADMRLWDGTYNSTPIGNNGQALDGLAWEMKTNFSLVSQPKVIGQAPTSECLSKTVIKDGFAYVVSTYNGLDIYNISDPKNPKLCGTYSSPAFNNYNDFAIGGNKGYLTTYNGLIILDIRQPAKPVRLGTIPTTTVGGAAVDSEDPDLIYVSEGNVPQGRTRFSCFDCINPSTPTIVSSLTFPEQFSAANTIAIRGNVAYIGGLYLTGGNGTGVLMTVDITDLSAMKFMAYTPIGNSWQISDVKLAGNRAYVADSSFGSLGVVDITNPAQPLSISSTVIGRDLWSIDICGYWLFATNRTGGLLAYNVANDSQPVLAASVKSVNASGVTVSNNLIYIATGFGGSGLSIVDPAQSIK